MRKKNIDILHYHIRLNEIFRAQRIFLRGTILEYLTVSLFFIILITIFTNFTILSGGHQLFIEGAGDGTAGFLWLNYVDKDNSPLYQYTDMVNYPVGEKLSSPLFISWSSLLFPLWVFSKLFSPIWALNIVTFFGFFSCAMTMYWLIKRLTGDISVAIFAGFAATFMPYHLIKSSSHLAYIFSYIFILIFAAILGLMLKPTIMRATLVSLSIAIAYYTDGYYLLIASVFAAVLATGTLIYKFIERSPARDIIKLIKYYIFSLLVLAILSMPIIIVQLNSSSDISSSLSKNRANIATEIQYYSAKYYDYLIPSANHPLLMHSEQYKVLNNYKDSRSNSSENTLYIGYVLIVLSIIGMVFVLYGGISHNKSATLNKLNKSIKRKYTLISVLFIITVITLILFTLSPKTNLFNYTLRTPSWFLIYLDIAYWRVMARFFLPLHVMFVIFSSFTLWIILKTSRKIEGKSILRVAVAIILIILLSFEYATNTARPSFDFNNMPKAYFWLKEQPDIKVVAELPFLDRPHNINYDFVTAQIIHGKKIINSHLNNTIGTRTILGDIDDPEAVAYAINRGADVIISHGKECYSTVAWGSLIFEDSNTGMDKEKIPYQSPICIYKIDKKIPTDTYFPKLRYGMFADAPNIERQAKFQQSALLYGTEAIIETVDQYGNNVTGNAKIEFNIEDSLINLPLTGKVQIIQDGVVINEVAIPSKIVGIIDASKPITLKVNSIDNRPIPIYQYQINDLIITKLQI